MPAAALRAARALASRRVEALTAPMTSQLEEIVDVMAVPTVEAAFEPEKAIRRKARVCSPVLAALLTAPTAELLRGRAAEIFVERLPKLPVYWMRPRLADFATGV